MSDDPYKRSVDAPQGIADSELELVARLFRALLHRVRGDLSVVTNDLVYLASLVDPAELERPRVRCASIATALSSLGLLTSASSREHRPLTSLAEIFDVTAARALDPSLIIALDEGLMRQAVQLLRKLLGSWTGSLDSVCEASEEMVCVLYFEQPRSLQRSYSSVGRMAAAELGERFVVEACIVDLILRDHDWQVHFIGSGDRSVCEITLKRCWG